MHSLAPTRVVGATWLYSSRQSTPTRCALTLNMLDSSELGGLELLVPYTGHCCRKQTLDPLAPLWHNVNSFR